MYYYIYKTTDLRTGKYYIGMHSTKNLDDGYMGSGTRIKWLIKKYGKENFKMEILEYLPNKKALQEREKEIVNKKLLNDSMCLNLKEGGEGGFPASAKLAFRAKMLKKKYKAEFSKKCSERNKRDLAAGVRKPIQPYDWTGKKHRPETIQKMKEVKKGQGTKETNSQYGTMWITNGVENKKIKNFFEIPEGWYKGRVATK
jgi:hypothetical protein